MFCMSYALTLPTVCYNRGHNNNNEQLVIIINNNTAQHTTCSYSHITTCYCTVGTIYSVYNE